VSATASLLALSVQTKPKVKPSKDWGLSTLERDSWRKYLRGVKLNGERFGEQVELSKTEREQPQDGGVELDHANEGTPEKTFTGAG
jgi:hypothetical protein